MNRGLVALFENLGTATLDDEVPPMHQVWPWKLCTSIQTRRMLDHVESQGTEEYAGDESLTLFAGTRP